MTLREFGTNVKQYLINILIAFDSLINTIFGGAPSDTISGRAERAKLAGRWWGKQLCSFLNWIQPHHGEMALKHDQEGRHDEAIDLE